MKLNTIQNNMDLVNKQLTDNCFNLFNMKESQLTLDILKQSFKKIHVVLNDDLYIFNPNIFNILEQKKNELLAHNDIIYFDEINNIINNFTYDNNNTVTNFTKTNVEKIVSFVHSVYNGSCFELININNEIEKYKKYEQHNELVNKNKYINEFNDDIAKQINWSEYKLLKNKLKTLECEFNYFQVCSEICICKNIIEYFHISNNIN